MAASAAAALFPTVPEIQPGELYEKIVQQATAEYGHYKTFLPQVNTLEKTIEDWTAKYSDPTKLSGKVKEQCKEELSEVVDQYLVFRGIREHCRQMLKIFDDTITQLSPPPNVHLGTLITMQRLGHSTTHFKKKYDEVFVTGLKQLTNQRKEIQSLFDRMVRACPRLRQAFENLACHCSDTTSFFGLTRHVGATPYANAAVKAKFAEKI